MPWPICNVGLVVTLSGQVIVFGGKTLEETVSDVYIFDCKSMFKSVGNLEKPDSFPMGGDCSVLLVQRECLIVGRDYIHRMSSEKSSKFSIYMNMH